MSSNAQSHPPPKRYLQRALLDSNWSVSVGCGSPAPHGAAVARSQLRRNHGAPGTLGFSGPPAGGGEDSSGKGTVCLACSTRVQQ